MNDLTTQYEAYIQGFKDGASDDEFAFTYAGAPLELADAYREGINRGMRVLQDEQRFAEWRFERTHG